MEMNLRVGMAFRRGVAEPRLTDSQWTITLQEKEQSHAPYSTYSGDNPTRVQVFRLVAALSLRHLVESLVDDC